MSLKLAGSSPEICQSTSWLDENHLRYYSDKRPLKLSVKTTHFKVEGLNRAKGKTRRTMLVIHITSISYELYPFAPPNSLSPIRDVDVPRSTPFDFCSYPTLAPSPKLVPNHPNEKQQKQHIKAEPILQLGSSPPSPSTTTTIALQRSRKR